MLLLCFCCPPVSWLLSSKHDVRTRPNTYFQKQWSRNQSQSQSIKTPYDLLKIKNHSHKIGMISFLLTRSAYNPIAQDLVKTRLSESEAGAGGETNHHALSLKLWLVQLYLPLLATPNVSRLSDAVVQSDATQLRASDYEFDSVASGKQSFVCEPSLIAVTHSIVQLPNSLVSNNDSSF